MSGVDRGEHTQQGTTSSIECDNYEDEGYFAQQRSPVYKNYSGKLSRGLGGLQIIYGFLFIIANVICIYVNAWGTVTQYGIWGGFVFICAGGLGIVSGIQKTENKIAIFLVLSIVSAGISTATVRLTIEGWVQNSDPERLCKYDTDLWKHSCSTDYYMALSMNVAMMFLSVAEATVAIWSSLICSDVICCRSNTRLKNTVPGIHVVGNYHSLGSGKELDHSIEGKVGLPDFVPIYPEGNNDLPDLPPST